MTKVTYNAPNGDALETVWGDYTFRDGKAVDVTDAHIVKKARTNPHFSVEGKDPEPEAKKAEKDDGKPKKVDTGKKGSVKEPERPTPANIDPSPASPTKTNPHPKPDPRAEGLAAAKGGMSDAVPAAYRGKAEEALWIEGFLSHDDKAKS